MSDPVQDLPETWLSPDLGVRVRSMITYSVGPNDVTDFNLAFHAGETTHTVQHRADLQHMIGARRVQWLKQAHGTRCVAIEQAELPGEEPVADAMWTREQGIALAILTADCLPVLLASTDGSCVAVAHAGWQGLARGVLAETIAKIPVAAGDLLAFMGPAISGAVYEVGEDVWRQFPSRFAGPHADPAKRYLDLIGIARAQLESLGVMRIEGGDLCTFRDGGYYSHRRWQQAGGVCGRFASVIMRL